MIVALSGWVVSDRLKWAGNERQIEINTGRLDKLEAWRSVMPAETISRAEHIALLDEIKVQHLETMTAIRHLEARLDSFTVYIRQRAKNESFDVTGARR